MKPESTTPTRHLPMTQVGVVTEIGDRSPIVSALGLQPGVEVVVLDQLDTGIAARLRLSLVVVEDFAPRTDTMMFLRAYFAAVDKGNGVPASIIVATTARQYGDEQYRVNLHRAGATGILSLPRDADTLARDLLNVACWGPQRETHFSFEELTIDFEQMSLFYEGRMISRDQQILEICAILITNSHNEVVTTYEQLEERLGLSSRQVRVCMTRLRRELKPFGDPIANVWGRGYVIKSRIKTASREHHAIS